jgi:hypothetical protein
MSGLGKLTGLCLGLAILAVVTAPDVARGQVAGSPSEITIQLRTGTLYIRKALENLGNSEQAQAYILQAYIQLRDAHAKMQNANGVAGFPYPLYAIAMPQVYEARSIVQGALTALKDGGIPLASARLNEALQMTETVLLTLF